MAETTTRARRDSGDLSALLLPELRKIATNLGIEGASDMKKPDLVTAITDLQAANREAAKANAKRVAQLDTNVVIVAIPIIPMTITRAKTIHQIQMRMKIPKVHNKVHKIPIIHVMTAALIAMIANGVEIVTVIATAAAIVIAEDANARLFSLKTMYFFR